ncbi:anaerobic C4-dicarboxylate transporter, partial [Vibrio fluvialis]|nr:anaerobic C4-dicarboxylate transporter [Vibrio fluvialis]
AASVASQIAITASPISAAVVYYLAELSNINHNITLLSILMVSVPATLFGTVLMSLYSLRRGKELEDDKEYQARLQDPVLREKIFSTTATSLNEHLPASAKNSVLLFILSIIVIVLVAMFPEVRQIGDAKPINMATVIQMMMLCFGGIILLVTKVNPKTVPEGVVFKSGMVAAIAI